MGMVKPKILHWNGKQKPWIKHFYDDPWQKNFVSECFPGYPFDPCHTSDDAESCWKDYLTKKEIERMKDLNLTAMEYVRKPREFRIVKCVEWKKCGGRSMMNGTYKGKPLFKVEQWYANNESNASS